MWPSILQPMGRVMVLMILNVLIETRHHYLTQTTCYLTLYNICHNQNLLTCFETTTSIFCSEQLQQSPNHTQNLFDDINVTARDASWQLAIHTTCFRQTIFCFSFHSKTNFSPTRFIFHKFLGFCVIRICDFTI